MISFIELFTPGEYTDTTPYPRIPNFYPATGLLSAGPIPLDLQAALARLSLAPSDDRQPVVSMFKPSKELAEDLNETTPASDKNA